MVAGSARMGSAACKPTSIRRPQGAGYPLSITGWGCHRYLVTERARYNERCHNRCATATGIASGLDLLVLVLIREMASSRLL